MLWRKRRPRQQSAPFLGKVHGKTSRVLREKASAAISKFTKQPIELVRLNRPNLSTPALKGADYAWWLDVMKQQDMLQAKVDPAQLVLP